MPPFVPTAGFARTSDREYVEARAGAAGGDW